jgi:hypothetical protein
MSRSHRLSMKPAGRGQIPTLRVGISPRLPAGGHGYAEDVDQIPRVWRRLWLSTFLAPRRHRTARYVSGCVIAS